MTFFFSGFGFILHLAHHLASLSRFFCRYSTAKSIFLLKAYWPASSANCDLIGGLVVSWIWLVIDIDKESNRLRFEPCGTPAFG